VNNILILAVGGVWGLFTVYFIYARTKADNDFRDFKVANKAIIDSVDIKVLAVSKDLSAVVQKQVEHEFNFVTEKHVREILKEEVKDIKTDISTVKGHVGTILDSLQSLNIAIGIQNGLREEEMQRGRRDRDK
tara:strand:+ start:298 stop:696 length:399 start_codon:yes stop_codon:yes gene_type:complete